MFHKFIMFALALVASSVFAQTAVGVGTIEGVSGTVTATPSGAAGTGAQSGRAITDGMNITTGPGSSVTLNFNSGCTLTLQPNTTITVNSNMTCNQLQAAVQRVLPGGGTAVAAAGQTLGTLGGPAAAFGLLVGALVLDRVVLRDASPK